MKIFATLPFDRIDHPAEFLEPQAVIEVGAALEAAGFYGASVTDHPCPTGRWLDAGGHYAQDPFVMLSLLASVTKTLTLKTGILVLPYRNPFITARSVATLDVFSRGRVILGVGAGYLKGEYRALGVDFERRNEIMDEYILAMKAAWTQDEFTFQGTGYQAFGNRILPRPLQRPHPPLLIGGNSKRAIRRAVELGDAWTPFFNSPGVSATSRTATIADADDLAAGIAYMRNYSHEVGRKEIPQVVVGGVLHPAEDWNPQLVLDRIAQFRNLGVDVGEAHIDGRTRAEYCDNVERFGAEVIAALG